MMSKQQQRQVWQRVYHQSQPARPVPPQALRQSRQRLQQNVQFYESQRRHQVYGPAFEKLIAQTEEQLQMLRQIAGEG